MAVEIRGTGSYIPEKIVENRELEQMVETTDVWIRERTGICRRHIAEKETVVDMGTRAAVQALQHSGISAQEIDLLIVSYKNTYELTCSLCVFHKRCKK